MALQPATKAPSASKRKLAQVATAPSPPPPTKKPRTIKKDASPTPLNAPNSALLREPHHLADEAEEHGIVLRDFYPREMNNVRAKAYNDNILPRPIELLTKALADTSSVRSKVEVKDAVVHWFKMDLRTYDNRALSMASRKAAEAGVPLICVYLVSPEDFTAHLRAPVRVDFMMRTLAVLKKDLAALDVPLHVETVGKRKDIPQRMLALMASHLFANMEYEVDELRREAKMHGMSMEVLHDSCIVPPGLLASGSGKQYSVYSPWFRAWVAYLHSHMDLLLDVFDPPTKNPASVRKGKHSTIFDSEIPDVPKNKALSTEEKKRFHALWPAGEHEAIDRLNKFVEERISRYSERRNFPGDACTSSISVHLAAGTLSARTAVRAARDKNKGKNLDAGAEGIKTWISEVAWRDFYKHVLVHWPYICMNKPFKPEYSNIEWSYDMEHFQAWKDGRTGFPIVDAAMRQCKATGWMHNRCRMIVASFLCKDLLIDWRLGERYFMETLIDGDFASNNGGWGFSASCGVDPQPYFRIFNPLLQSEKFDPQGEYIRKWIPELKGVQGAAIHDPYGRTGGLSKSAAGKEGAYPQRILVAVQEKRQ
ncbi:putative Deoxyribodipyrimidine photo-lyase [Microdochium trichocladiopsis]|uniref:Deoxyribodipyrimidine photo-lyase n=1 Tax=Microdochium trichocladiopsis TaxID=1682393 RepID=A0A9P8YCP4_9PEZI|nr:putative Deoxyribodipyrimidine photo-lyase [Microdochium trichocladiopsis]KAH7034623.1 putative Deoxyribodipyrimidine photo-lyase [Microdochium trichocladiopsis]